MRGRTIVLFVIALALAGGTATLVRSWLAQRPQIAAASAKPAPVVKTSILVAHVPIARGQILKPRDVVWQTWPDTAVNANFIVSRGPQKSYAGWVAREPFVAGEPIVKAKIVGPGDRGFLAAVLQPGMRAVSVPVDPASDVSGFVFPGDRVDLLIDLSLQPESGGGGNGYAHKAVETMLRDIRVLAIDQRLDSKDGQAVVARNVTLEVTPKQSETVALALEMGKLTLSLRGLVATPPNRPPVLSLADATGNSDAAPPADSLDGHASPSVTLDSDVSPLVPKPFMVNQNHNDGTVTILRGNGNNGTSVASQPGSRGS